MSVTPRYFSPTNAFIPEATGQVVAYIRKPGKFKLLDYVQTVGSEETNKNGKPICTFAIIDPDEPVRVGPISGPTVSAPDIAGTGGPSSDAQWRWAPGDDAPRGNIALNFKWQTVEMQRRAYPYEVDEQTDSASDLPYTSMLRETASSIAMSVKTQRVIKMLENTSNWPAASVVDANTLNGNKGPWNKASSDEQSPSFNAIRLAVAQMTVNIVQAVNGAISPEDLRVIISPNVALRLGSTGEIYNYVKSSQFSKDRQEGRNQLNEQYLMPKYYAGVEWVIEDAMQVTEERNSAGTAATTNRGWIKNDTTAIMVSRKGGIDGVYGSPAFSTVQIFYYKFDMAVEEEHDNWNKKLKGRVVDQYAEVLAATRAGGLITNIFG